MKLYVRTRYSDPQLGAELLNVAELEELSDTECEMVRMIEMDPGESITGIYHDGRVEGEANRPLDKVPHPDTHGRFPGITTTRIAREEFEGLWQEARAKLGG